MQTKNRIRNKAYLEQYADILSKVMGDKINGQSILYIVKGILVSGKCLEECWGFELLDIYLKQQQEIEKIEYIRQHMNILNKNLMDMLDGQSVLYAIKEILVSDRTLKNCCGYEALNQYIIKNEEKVINQSQELQNRAKREELGMLHILSSVVSFAHKGHDMNQVSQITSLYQYVGDEKEPQKQLA